MSEADNWSTGANILDSGLLEKVRSVIERQPVIVEHSLYRGSSAPIRAIFEEFEDFLDHLKSRAQPGDRFIIWGFCDLCRNDNCVVDGKYPDERGHTPLRGSY
jgi:hypothetical protein